MIFKKNIFMSLFLGSLVLAPCAYAGKVEVTAYYPPPYAEYMTLKSTKASYFATNGGGQNVGIGTLNPDSRATLDVNGYIFNSGGSLIFSTATGTHTTIGNTAGWAAIENASNYNTLMLLGRSGGLGGGRSVSFWDRLDVNGTAYVTGGAWSGSDIRRKTNIAPLSENTLDKVLKLRGVRFDWKQEEGSEIQFPKGRQIGLIAQEVEKEFPQLVSTDGQGYKTVAYDRLTAVLLEAMKAQQKEIELLKKEIKELSLKKIT